MFSLLKKRKTSFLSFFFVLSLHPTPPTSGRIRFTSRVKKKKVNKARKCRTRREGVDCGWLREGPRKTWSSFLSCAGREATAQEILGDTGWNEIEFPLTRDWEDSGPLPAPPTPYQPPSCGPRLRPDQSRAQEPRGGPGETRPHLGWRPNSSRGSWAPSSHARPPQFAGAQRVAACSDRGIPAPPGPPGAGGWGRGRESPLPASFGWGQGPSPSACRFRELRSPGWTLTAARRPRFWGAAMMDVRWPAGHRQRSEALITGLRRESRGERDLRGQALWSAFIIHEKQSCLGQTPGRPYSPGDPTTPSPPRRLPSAPQTRQARSRPPAPRPQAPRVNVALASFSRPGLDEGARSLAWGPRR